MSQPGPTLTIGTRRIGAGCPVFIIAEIGYNFTSPEEAIASIDAAVASGVDMVKFQTFRAETLTSRQAEFPAEAGGTNQFDEFQRYEISEALHRDLFAHARRRGVIACSTPSYMDDVELLERLEVPVYKIGSDDLTNLPFLRYVAEKGKPVLFSTGMGTLEEVQEALQAIRETGNQQIGVFHCVSNYPVTDLRLVNLPAIRTLQQACGVPVGFSDHTTSLGAAMGAVALGASLIERHFTLDKRLPVPDAAFSADPQEMTALVKAIRELEAALSGDGLKRPAETESAMRVQTRKSVIARSEIQAGELIGGQHIIIKRPATGIEPKLSHLVVGKRAKTTIRKDEAITWEKLA